jgi:RNA polymerase sigma factor (sigma-70 family)
MAWLCASCETYFQVWSQAVRFDPQKGAAVSWLLTMARSRAIDALRKEAKFTHDELGVPGQVDHHLHSDEQSSSDQLLELSRNSQSLHNAMLMLAPQPRQLLALAFFRGLSHEEIASHMALPLGTVKTQIRRSLISLKDSLGAIDRP